MDPRLRDLLAEAFLDYYNNYLTVRKFAACWGLTETQASAVVSLGREIHESQFAKTE